MRKIGVFILFYFGTTLFMSCQDEKVKFMIPDEEMIKILNIPPHKKNDLLKADIKNIYESKYAFL